MSDVLARAEIAISANLSGFDKAMDALPKKAQGQIKKSVDAINAEMAKVGQALGQSKSLAEVQKLTEYYAKLKTSLDAVKQSAISQAQALGPANQALRDAGGASGFASNKLQIFAQGLDDLQYVPEQGLRPILNNLVQMSPALGIAGLVLQQFIVHWDDLAKLFGQGHVKTQAEEMEELGKKTEKTAEETAKLLNYEERRKNLDAQRGKTDERGEATGKINDAIRNAPESNIRKILENLHGNAIGNSIGIETVNDLDNAKAANAAAQAANQAAQGNPRISRAAKDEAKRRADLTSFVLKSAQEAYDKAYVEALDKIQADLATNPKAFKGFIDQAEKGKLLPKGVIKNLRDAAKTPDEIEQEKSDEYYRKQDEEMASRQAAYEESLRVQKRDEDEAADKYYDQQDIDLDSRAASYQEDRRLDQLGRDQSRVAPLEDKLIPGLLERIARGEEVNQEKLQNLIEDKIAGLGIKDPSTVAANLASKTIEDTNAQIAQRKLTKGGTVEQNALALAKENVQRLKGEAEKNRPSYGVTDIEGYHREVQDSILKGSGNEVLVEEQKRATDAYIEAQKNLQELTAAIKAKGNKLVLD